MAYTPAPSFTESSLTLACSSPNDQTHLLPQYQIKVERNIHDGNCRSRFVQWVRETMMNQVVGSGAPNGVTRDDIQLPTPYNYVSALAEKLRADSPGWSGIADGGEFTRSRWSLPYALLVCSKESSHDLGFPLAGSDSRADICQMVAIELLSDCARVESFSDTALATLEMAVEARAYQFLAHPVVVRMVSRLYNKGLDIIPSPGDSRLASINHRLAVIKYHSIMRLISLASLTSIYLLIMFQILVLPPNWIIVLATLSTGTLLSEIVQLEKTTTQVRINRPGQFIDFTIWLIILAYTASSSAFYIPLPSFLSSDYLLTGLTIALLPRVAWLSIQLIAPRRSSHWSQIGSKSLAYVLVGITAIVLGAAMLALALVRVFANEPVPLSWRLVGQVWDNELWSECTIVGQRWLLISWIYSRVVTWAILVVAMMKSLSKSSSSSSSYEGNGDARWSVRIIKEVRLNQRRSFQYMPPLNVLEWALRPTKWVLTQHAFECLNQALVTLTHAPLLMILPKKIYNEEKQHETDHHDHYYQDAQYGATLQPPQDYFGDWHDDSVSTCYPLNEDVDDNEGGDNIIDDNSINDNIINDNSINDNSINDDIIDHNSINDNSISDNSINDNSINDTHSINLSYAQNPNLNHNNNLRYAQYNHNLRYAPQTNTPTTTTAEVPPRVPLLRKRPSMYYAINGTGLLQSPLLPSDNNDELVEPVLAARQHQHRSNGLIWRLLSERSMANLRQNYEGGEGKEEDNDGEKQPRWSPEEIDDLV